ncbi:hypothetical protein GGR51DRAFT_530819 [Nemania sp. FL0031]|nr:hypothetical protein GGR51DRAFT_530819 [Nemania sp. FL0031]
MKFSTLKATALAAILQTTSASPMRGRIGLPKVLATTTTAHGQTLDWILPESQTDGEIAQPPPPPLQKRDPHATQAMVRALLGDTTQGPNGTVPILRPSSNTKAVKRLPTKEDDERSPKVNAADASNAGKHWYATTGQNVLNRGGKARYSLFKAFTEKDSDFSLLQTAVFRGNVPRAGSNPVTQTVEAGWINYPDQVGAPHLFTFFTTNGYGAAGDHLGCWNTDCAGWVQVDKDIHPGLTFSLSTIGGTQYDLEIGYLLYGGNWWLWCLDRYIGYYPGSLFSKGVKAADTLADHGEIIEFYGEIFNGEDALTTTDMGSGEWPKTGLGKSAYIRNIQYYDKDGIARNYNGNDQLIVSDSQRYDLVTDWSQDTNFGSHFFLGGPGAGGKVNA